MVENEPEYSVSQAGDVIRRTVYQNINKERTTIYTLIPGWDREAIRQNRTASVLMAYCATHRRKKLKWVMTLPNGKEKVLNIEPNQP